MFMHIERLLDQGQSTVTFVRIPPSHDVASSRNQQSASESVQFEYTAENRTARAQRRKEDIPRESIHSGATTSRGKFRCVHDSRLLSFDVHSMRSFFAASISRFIISRASSLLSTDRIRPSPITHSPMGSRSDLFIL